MVKDHGGSDSACWVVMRGRDGDDEGVVIRCVDRVYWQGVLTRHDGVVEDHGGSDSACWWVMRGWVERVGGARVG